jgi:hypothetical protein
VLKYFFTITFLALIACKVVEPLINAVRFEQTSNEVMSVSENDIIEVKSYLPIPYHSGGSEIQETSTKTCNYEGHFYNIVEKRFSNDTLYLKLQDNLSARERFDALSNAVKSIVTAEATEKNTPAKKTMPSLEDITKVFLPAKIPTIQNENWSISEVSSMQYKDNTLLFSNPFLFPFAPPPKA